MHQKGAGIQGSSNYDQGSSWAVEVGSHLKVCSIIVENLNKNGQMLVEVCMDHSIAFKFLFFSGGTCWHKRPHCSPFL